MGRITLETYIFQFHIWMRTTGLNGSPKKLLVVFADSYWLNFVILSTIYIFISLRFSHLTGVLRDALIPDNLQTMGRVISALIALGLLCWILSLWWTGSLCLQCEKELLDRLGRCLVQPEKPVKYVFVLEQGTLQSKRCCFSLYTSCVYISKAWGPNSGLFIFETLRHIHVMCTAFRCSKETPFPSRPKASADQRCSEGQIFERILIIKRLHCFQAAKYKWGNVFFFFLIMKWRSSLAGGELLISDDDRQGTQRPEDHKVLRRQWTD